MKIHRNFKMVETNGVRLRTVVEARSHLSFCCMAGLNAGICGVIRSTL
jgi:hypothetical protein